MKEQYMDTEKASAILQERDYVKRDAMIDALTEEEAKVFCKFLLEILPRRGCPKGQCQDDQLTNKKRPTAATVRINTHTSHACNPVSRAYEMRANTLKLNQIYPIHHKIV